MEKKPTSQQRKCQVKSWFKDWNTTKEKEKKKMDTCSITTSGENFTSDFIHPGFWKPAPKQTLSINKATGKEDNRCQALDKQPFPPEHLTLPASTPQTRLQWYRVRRRHWKLTQNKAASSQRSLLPAPTWPRCTTQTACPLQQLLHFSAWESSASPLGLSSVRSRCFNSPSKRSDPPSPAACLRLFFAGHGVH